MVDYFRYRRTLSKLLRQKTRLRAVFRAEISKAHREGKPRAEIESLESQGHFEESMVDEEIAILATDHLIRKAQRRFVPVPARDEGGMWIQCDRISNRYVLTNRGISHLRSCLRTERKEQVEIFVIVVAVITGIIGAATGLVAVILR